LLAILALDLWVTWLWLWARLLGLKLSLPLLAPLRMMLAGEPMHSCCRCLQSSAASG